MQCLKLQKKIKIKIKKRTNYLLLFLCKNVISLCMCVCTRVLRHDCYSSVAVVPAQACDVLVSWIGCIELCGSAKTEFIQLLCSSSSREIGEFMSRNFGFFELYSQAAQALVQDLRILEYHLGQSLWKKLFG